MLIWTYKNLIYQDIPNPISCPEDECRRGMRLFYPTSDAKTDPKKSHRSLYWFEKKKLDFP